MPQLGRGSNSGTGNDSCQAVPQALLTALWPCCLLPPGLINPQSNSLRGTGLCLCYRLGNKLREVNRLPKVIEHTGSRAKTQTKACWQRTPATPAGGWTLTHSQACLSSALTPPFSPSPPGSQSPT